jgi:hypothetical protein
MIELIPHEVATKMMLAVNWDPADYKVRDRISSAIADECERRNKKKRKSVPESEVQNPLFKYLH